MAYPDKSYGSKYAANKDASTTDIAKMIRADIKAAVKSGELPKAKYSVRSDYYSMGSSINVRISNVPGPTFNAAWFVWNEANPYARGGSGPEEARERFAPKVTDALKKLEEIVDAYNYNGSDSSTDYYDVNFSGSVSAEYDEAVYKMEKAMALADDAAVYALAVKVAAEVGTVPIPAPAKSEKPKLFLVPSPKPEPMNDHEAFLTSIGAM